MENVDGSLQAMASADDFERKVVEEFQNAWQNAIAGISPPDMEVFLKGAGVGNSTELVERLRALDSDFRNRLAVGKTKTPSGNSTAEQSLAQEKTIIGPVPLAAADSTGPPQDPAAFAGTVDWIMQEDPKTSEPDSPLAPTVIDDTGEGGKDPTDPAGGQAPATQSIIQRIAGYEILGTLGRGGMGVVYRARQIGLNRYVALKMILDGRHVAPEILSRFRIEAEAVAQLQHPNIVQIYDIGTQDGLPFFSLELVDGPSLAAEMAGQPMPARRAAGLTETLARAMHYAHIRGIVHRDLKPANVLLTSTGVPKVTDFGLVKRLEAEDSEQTRTGVIMGTPSYMAPEQAWGSKEVGPLADVYALGATLYALLTGRPPFLGPTPAETVMQLRHEEPVPPSRLQPNLPPDLETICLKCLQKEPEKRYASAEELAEDLGRFQAGKPILARPVSRAERVWRWCRRNPVLATTAGIAAVLAFCLMIGGPLAALLINEEREAAVTARQKAEDNEGFAREQRQLALDALETLIERVPSDLRNVGKTNGFKQVILRTAMNGLDQIGNVGGKEYRDYLMAKAHAKMGEVLLEIGQTDAAEAQFTKCHSILLELAETDAETSKSTHQLRLGRSYRNLARALERKKGAQAALPLYLKALEVRQAALPIHHDPLHAKQEIAESCGDLGRLALDSGRAQEAMDYFTKSLAYRDEWVTKTQGNPEALRAQAGARWAVGHGHLYLGETAKAAEMYQSAANYLSLLAKENTPDTTNKTNAALCYNDLGTAHLLSGNAELAFQYYDKARFPLEEMFRDNGYNYFVLRKLGKTYYCLATASEWLKNPKDAHFRERSLFARRQLYKTIAPKDRTSKQDYMLSLALDGQIAEASNLADELAKEAPKEPDALYIVACTYSLCAATHERSKDDPASIPSAEKFREKALKTLRAAVEAGYHAKAMMKLDPDLAAVREEPGFQNLIDSFQVAESKPR